ncbi:MAG: NAD(P)-dependent glycerol-3-phosphate dehydrogenase, partial [Chlorobia bacterium]|nr:NAD(P)-dependent glycerol-3-phosphate dehydrogenase [Fimbriimonadaceae bacterium]
PEEIAILRSTRENLKYLPGFVLPENVSYELLHEHLEPVDMTVVAVPSSAVRQVVHEVSGQHPLVVVAAKGLEPGSAKMVSDVVAEALPNAHIGAISGPNLAVEIVRGIPTAAIAACRDDNVAEQIRAAFNCRTFRVYKSDDVTGVELAGALKNVIAVGAGMSDGLGFGDNTKGAFLARGLKEMIGLGLKMGARLETFLGIAGVGDLFATASSNLSRNYRAGRLLGQGKSLSEALIEVGQVVEGVSTSESVQSLARRYETEMPVFAAIESVIHGQVNPLKAVGMLMERDTPTEGLPIT